MRTHFLLLAFALNTACDDGKIDLGEYEDGGDGSGEETNSEDSGNNDPGPENDDSNPTDSDDTGAEDSDTAEPVPLEDIDEDGFTVADGDCDDNNPSIHPAARERCDDIDHDCDGMYYNDVLVRYDINIVGPWHGDRFPSTYPYDDAHIYSELWNNYRDYDTDMKSYGMYAPTYEGDIHPIVLQSVEVEGEPDNFRWRYIHNPDGQLIEEIQTSDGYEYSTSYEYSPEGWLLKEDSVEIIDEETVEYSRELSYDETGRVLVEESFFNGDLSGSITTIYDDAANTKREDWDYYGDGIVDYISFWTYRDDGQPSLYQQDYTADETWEYEERYTYTESGLLSMLESTDWTTTIPYISRTTYGYDTAGNLVSEDHDYDNDGFSEEWTRNTYLDGHLNEARYGTHDDDDVEVEEYAEVYERDLDGNWTTRTTTSSVSWISSGVEYATLNLDGHWAGWDWDYGDMDAAGSMTTTCLGAPSPATIDEFMESF